MSDVDTDIDTAPGFSLEFFASMSADLGGLRAELKRMNDRNSAAEKLPRQIPLFQQATDANPSTVLDFGGPANGRQWEVRLLGVISATSAGFIAMATTFTTWYVGQKVTGNAPNILPLGLIRWQFPSVPNFEELSGDQMRVQPRENLYAGLTGIPANPTQIMCIAVVNDMPIFSGRAVVGT